VLLAQGALIRSLRSLARKPYCRTFYAAARISLKRLACLSAAWRFSTSNYDFHEVRLWVRFV